MLTNIIGIILITIMTNTYSPPEYWYDSAVILCGNDLQCVVDGYWSDVERRQWPSDPAKTRDNPDVQFVEVHEIRTLEFECEGPQSVELSDKLISKTKRIRTVKTTEEWEEQKVEPIMRMTGTVTSVTNYTTVPTNMTREAK